MPRQRGLIDATVQVDGLRELHRAFKKSGTGIEREMKSGLRDVAEDIAREARQRMPARSFSYKGYGTGAKAIVRSTGPKAFVGRFIETGFHPRGSGTFVEGRYVVGGVIEDRQERIVEGVADVVDKTTRSAGWR